MQQAVKGEQQHHHNLPAIDAKLWDELTAVARQNGQSQRHVLEEALAYYLHNVLPSQRLVRPDVMHAFEQSVARNRELMERLARCRTVPDLIVTDLNMPEMTGIELISLVRRRYPAILIVAMSGDYQGEAVPAGVVADGFYPKGQHPHKLLTAIAMLMESQSARSIHGNRSRETLNS